MSPPAGPAVGLWVCLEFGGEDSGDGSLCGRRRNKQVPLLYHLPDEPGECWDYCAISQFSLVLLSKRVGWKASSGEKSVFCKSTGYLALWGPQLWCCCLPVLVPSASGRLCSLSHMTCCCTGCSWGWCCLWIGQHSATPALAWGTVVSHSLHHSSCDGCSFERGKMLLVLILSLVIEARLWILKLSGKIKTDMYISECCVNFT